MNECVLVTSGLGMIALLCPFLPTRLGSKCLFICQILKFNGSVNSCIYLSIQQNLNTYSPITVGAWDAMMNRKW